MAFIIPQITWPASAPANTLSFTYPPVEKPTLGAAGDEVEDVVADSITVSGLRQRLWWRQDEFKHLMLSFVPIADMANWRAFIDYAQQGGSFLYYPDATATTADEWWLEDSSGSARSQTSSASSSANWNPKYAFRNMASFELVMRKVPGGISLP